MRTFPIPIISVLKYYLLLTNLFCGFSSHMLLVLPSEDQTTFIITTDHGRGSGLVEWKEHGVEEKGSENIWIAVMGPDTQSLGERSNAPEVTQSEIAATIAAMLGKDLRTFFPAAGAVLPGIVGKTEH